MGSGSLLAVDEEVDFLEGACRLDLRESIEFVRFVRRSRLLCRLHGAEEARPMLPRKVHDAALELRDSDDLLLLVDDGFAFVSGIFLSM